MNTRNTLVRTLRNAALGTALFALLPVAAMAQDATLPEKIKAAKALVVGIEATYPPMAYKDPKTNQRVGVNVDLVESIAKELGVSVKWEEMTFEQLMTSLTTGRIDMIGTAISDLPSRREKLTFVDYLVTGAQPFTTVAKKGAIKTEADLCGKTVGAPRTTNYFPVAQAWSEKNCVAAGKPAATINGTAGATATRLDLKQGRLDAAVLGPEYVAYLMADEPEHLCLGRRAADQDALRLCLQQEGYRLAGCGRDGPKGYDQEWQLPTGVAEVRPRTSGRDRSDDRRRYLSRPYFGDEHARRHSAPHRGAGGLGPG